MKSIFCPSCGAKSEYQFAVPNFCSKCGKPYLENANSSVKVPPALSKMRNARFNQNPPEERDHDYDDDYDDAGGNDDDFSNASRVPRISRISVDIDSTTDVKVFKFEDLLSGGVSEFKRSKNRNLDDLVDEN